MDIARSSNHVDIARCLSDAKRCQQEKVNRKAREEKQHQEECIRQKKQEAERPRYSAGREFAAGKMHREEDNRANEAAIRGNNVFAAHRLVEAEKQRQQALLTKIQTALELDERNAMTNAAFGPVEQLSLEYIQQCNTKQLIGSGAFGEVFLGKDSRLANSFVIKKIKFEDHDADTIKEIRDSFRKEIKALTQYRHPNIIALYAFNLSVQQRDQFLVYEYAAEGPLDGFLRDDVGRARLSAGIRLSIMSQLTGAVHFLHSGGCKADRKPFMVYHRDIKSANICLSVGLSPKLIDCGMAKFVQDDKAGTSTSSRMSLISTSRGNIFGTEGYICTMYARGAISFQPACDVYSIGVVMVELILGCLIGGQSTNTFGEQFHDVFMRHVKDEYDEPIQDG